MMEKKIESKNNSCFRSSCDSELLCYFIASLQMLTSVYAPLAISATERKMLISSFGISFCFSLFLMALILFVGVQRKSSGMLKFHILASIAFVLLTGSCCLYIENFTPDSLLRDFYIKGFLFIGLTTSMSVYIICFYWEKLVETKVGFTTNCSK